MVFVFDARFRDPALYARDALAVVEPGAGWDPARWVPLRHFGAGPARLVPDGLLALLGGTPAVAGVPGEPGAV